MPIRILWVSTIDTHSMFSCSWQVWILSVHHGWCVYSYHSAVNHTQPAVYFITEPEFTSDIALGKRIKTIMWLGLGLTSFRKLQKPPRSRQWWGCKVKEVSDPCYTNVLCLWSLPMMPRISGCGIAWMLSVTLCGVLTQSPSDHPLQSTCLRSYCPSYPTVM